MNQPNSDPNQLSPSSPTGEEVMTQQLPEEDIPHLFRLHPWTATILASPDFYPIYTWSRLHKQGSPADGFFGKTLASNDTAPDCLTLRRRNLDPPDTTPPPWLSTKASTTRLESPDIVMLLSLSDEGTCSHAFTAHGGFVASLLDEAMSLAVALHVSQSPGIQNPPRGKVFTAQLDVRYKGHVSVPGILVIRAKLVAKQGRKYWLRAQALQEDEEVGNDGDSIGAHVGWVQRRSVKTDAMAFWLAPPDAQL